MLGNVPVQVMGSCEPGEALYASPDHPGIATAEYYIEGNSQARHKKAFIGFAFEKKKCQNETEVCISVI